MGRCHICGNDDPLIAAELGLCLRCIRTQPDEARRVAAQAHARLRRRSGLPPSPPKSAGGVACGLCVNDCLLAQGERGYCGVRWNEAGRLRGADRQRAAVSWYYDPLPTNCVADWVCAGGTGAGYPRFAYRPGPEYGYENLAVFFQACTFDCLFCQNWQFRHLAQRPSYHTAGELADAVRERTACICFFGGDPAAQWPYALEVVRRIRHSLPDRILRICWETNGSMSRHGLAHMLQASLETGGCIKFDLKALDDTLHQALTGSSNARTLENFRAAAARFRERPEPPLLVASTLLVPGYVDADEVYRIARFIAALDPAIPYSLLAFHPEFLMQDLPFTTRKEAYRCRDAAFAAGLQRVHIGNLHLLRDE